MALGLKLEGSRKILGFWVFGAEGESSHNWETILKELWEREVRRVRLFISDDLPGIEEAIRRIFPQATWQLCMVHAVRDALSKVREDEREEMAKDLKHLVGGHGKGSPQGSGGVQKQMGVEIPQDRGQVGHQKLCPVGVSGASQTDPALPLYHQLAGTPDKGGETAGTDGGDLL